MTTASVLSLTTWKTKDAAAWLNTTWREMFSLLCKSLRAAALVSLALLPGCGGGSRAERPPPGAVPNPLRFQAGARADYVRRATAEQRVDSSVLESLPPTVNGAAATEKHGSDSGPGVPVGQ